MGVKDIALKHYLSIPEIFAELFNIILFHGKKVLEAEKLENVDSSTSILLDDNGKIKPIQKHRDVIKKSALCTNFVIFAAENQMNISYSMPVRDMLYDSLNYAEQVLTIARNHRKDKDLTGDEFLSGMSKEDRLMPSITLTVYYGSEPWDGSMDIYGMLEMGENAELLKEYISNYKMNFLWVNEVEQLEQFQTGLRELFGVLKYQKDSVQLEQYIQLHEDRFRCLDKDTFNVIGVMVNADNIIKKIDKFKTEKGGYDMCQALVDIENRGITQGITQGEERLGLLIEKLMLDKRMDDILKCAKDAEHRSRLYKEYSL